MPPLIEKWNFLKDDDKDLFPLLEVNHYSSFFISHFVGYFLVLKLIIDFIGTFALRNFSFNTILTAIFS